jgi:RNA polymerase sigma factor (sigma-70 family)
LRQPSAALEADETPDQELLERFVAAHDETAFACLVGRYGPMVLAVCRSVLRHEQDAEDAFQATFLLLARKAAAVHQSLPAWLHAVALRVAVKAHTRAGRQPTPSPPPEVPVADDPALPLAAQELQRLLHEELDRLPEKYRAPLVLCYLQGHSQEEAAMLLGWSRRKVKGRLQRGRDRLRARLARRGLTLSAAMLSALAVPRSLTAAQVSAGSRTALAASLLPPQVTMLADAALPFLGTASARLATLGLLLAGLLCVAGVFWHVPATAQPPRDPPPAPPEPAERDEPLQPALVDRGDTVLLRGRVVDPDGKPLAGADVTVWWHSDEWSRWHARDLQPRKPRAGARSDADGRFRFSFAKAEMDDTAHNHRPEPWRYVQVIAAAKGYGPAWKITFDLHKEELLLRLVRDDLPLRGRVLDLQGQGVAGAVVHVEPFIEYDVLQQPSWTGLSDALTTDREGRFTATGLGRDRSVRVHVSGANIEQKTATVAMKPEKPGGDHAGVEIIVEPTKPIEGVVRSKDTGKPLAGVVIYGNEQAQRRRVRAITNAEGRYRLVGLPKAASYELTAYPPNRLVHVGAVVVVPDTEGLKPVRADMELLRGALLRFRLVDPETKRAVRGQAHYAPLQHNENYQPAERVFPSVEFQRMYAPDRDGWFEVVAYPGPGFLLAMLPHGPFLRARVDPKDLAAVKGDFDFKFVDLAEAYRLVDPKSGDEPLSFDLVLNRGRTVTGRLVDPDGKPIEGAEAYGLTRDATASRAQQGPRTERLKGATFTALGVYPGEKRTLSFTHEQRKLIGHVEVDGSEKEPLTVRLQPWGTFTGRLVDEQGKPLDGVVLEVVSRTLSRRMPRDCQTDREGRFRIERLLPDSEHSVLLRDSKRDFEPGNQFPRRTVSAGETLDLGDVKVKVRPKEEPKTPRPIPPPRR